MKLVYIFIIIIIIIIATIITEIHGSRTAAGGERSPVDLEEEDPIVKPYSS